MSINNLDKYYELVEEKIGTFITDNTDLKKGKNKDTYLIKDYEINDGKITLAMEMKVKFLSFLKEHKYDITVALYYIIACVFAIYKIKDFIYSIRYLDIDILNFNPIVTYIMIVSSLVFWLFSTTTKYFGLTGPKYRLLDLSIVLSLVWFTILTYNLVYNIIIPKIGRLEPDEFLSVDKILGLGWMGTIAPTFLIVIPLGMFIFKILYRVENKESIRRFKLQHYYNLDKNDKYSYNTSFIRDDMSGKKVEILEHDRWLHFSTMGATGSGKTSSVLLKVIVNDLHTMAKNIDKQKKLVKKWLEKGYVYLTKPFNDVDFSINYVKPNPGYEEKFKKKILKYRGAGMTVMAPDDSLTDKVYELATNKGFKVNRLDARRDNDGNPKKGSRGFNPFYISPLLSEWQRDKAIIKRATLFADVNQIIYEMKGKSDVYFTSINRIVTTSVSMVLMITYPELHPGKHPTLMDFLSIINNFERIRPYLHKLEEIDKEKNKYEAIIDIIKKDLLGDQQSKFIDHSRGLQVQINDFLLDDEIKRIMCSQDSIDMDKVLADGEITVVNIELGELGPINSPAFGLFFSIAFINAILRRPGDEWERLPHFWFVDEFPIVVSNVFESSFTLFRKFRVSMFIALQTSGQFFKNPFLNYLKRIIEVNVGHHIFFGRTNAEDGKMVSDLAGLKDEVIATEGYTSVSLLNENPKYSENERSQIKSVERITSYDQRSLDFQEVTYFTTRKGRALDARHGKVYFLTDAEKRSLKRYRVDWRNLMLEQTKITVKEETDDVNITEPSSSHIRIWEEKSSPIEEKQESTKDNTAESQDKISFEDIAQIENYKPIFTDNKEKETNNSHTNIKEEMINTLDFIEVGDEYKDHTYSNSIENDKRNNNEVLLQEKYNTYDNFNDEEFTQGDIFNNIDFLDDFLEDTE